MAEGKRKLVVVCGAGASTELGADGRRMPLMPQLNDIVCQALDAKLEGFANALLLKPGMSGTEFETALGEVFALEREFHRIERLRDVFLPQFANPQNHPGRRDQYINSAKEHLDLAQAVLRDTFYAEFGGPRVDALEAGNAWSMLANALSLDLSEMLIATTNYDPSATRGLEHLGYSVRRGFSDRASEPRILEPSGDLSAWRDKSVAVMHLHGAVGWYRTAPDRIEDHGADHPQPIAQLGPPALLYPEPNKDPDRGVVRELWQEFDTALSVASHVLVLGHSLADAHLVERLGPHSKEVAIMRRPSQDPEQRKAVESETRRQLVGARVIWGKFGSDGHIESDDAFVDWWGRASGVPEAPVSVDLDAESSG